MRSCLLDPVLLQHECQSLIRVRRAIGGVSKPMILKDMHGLIEFLEDIMVQNPDKFLT